MRLNFLKTRRSPRKEKEVEYLYIEADEDHASLQFREKKGDLIENENHRKNNCLITKLVYVHEGIENRAPQSKRHKLVNPYYFCGTSYGEENAEYGMKFMNISTTIMTWIKSKSISEFRWWKLD